MKASVILYTDNKAPSSVFEKVLGCIASGAYGNDLIIVAQRKIDNAPGCFRQIIVGEKPRHLSSIYAQILEGMRAAKHPYVFLAEHDVLYPPGYFTDGRLRLNKLTYNTNVLRFCKFGFYRHRESGAVLSQLSGPRNRLQTAFSRLLAGTRAGTFKGLAEPHEVGMDFRQTAIPAVDVRYGGNFTKHHYPKEFDKTAEYWGTSENMLKFLDLHGEDFRLPVYTCVYGGWPWPVNPLVIDPDCDYYCVTDGKTEPTPDTAWKPIREKKPKPTKAMNGRRLSRYWKMRSHELPCASAAPVSLYIDAHILLRRSPFEILAEMKPDDDLAIFPHPIRSDIAGEAAEVKRRWPKMARKAMSQVKGYGDKPQVRMAECGLLLRRKTDTVAKFNELWARMYAKGCERDQIPFPVAAAETGLKICYLPGNIRHGVYCDCLKSQHPEV